MKEQNKVAFLIQMGPAPLCMERGQDKVFTNILCEELPRLELGDIHM